MSETQLRAGMDRSSVIALGALEKVYEMGANSVHALVPIQSPYKIEVPDKYLDGDSIISRTDTQRFTGVNQLISSTDNTNVYNVGGGLTISKAVGFGGTFTLNVLNRDTQALVGKESKTIGLPDQPLSKGVDYQSNWVNLAYPHGLEIGDAVRYFSESQGSIEGLQSGVQYYIVEATQ